MRSIKDTFNTAITTDVTRHSLQPHSLQKRITNYFVVSPSRNFTLGRQATTLNGYWSFVDLKAEL